MKTVPTFFLLLLVFSTARSQHRLDGVYRGAEEMCSWDDKGKKHCYGDDLKDGSVWYYENVFTIKGDSVFLEQSPFYVKGKDTLHSSSDGGFYYYEGLLFQTGDHALTFRLVEDHCDYCGELIETDAKGEPLLNADGSYRYIKSKKEYQVQITQEGFSIGGSAYRKQPPKK